MSFWYDTKSSDLYNQDCYRIEEEEEEENENENETVGF